MNQETESITPPARTRLKLLIRGAVQGVGFRPLVFRLAHELALNGWVSNSATGVLIEAEGAQADLELFLSRLQAAPPPRSVVQGVESTWLSPVGYTDFQIRGSHEGEEKTTLVLPDLATCPECLRDILDPGNRRFGYPFTNCTNCGPRFTIIEAVPYDRVRTSMKAFEMCPQCQREYEDPRDRRFHAQPNACPRCGPQLALWDNSGRVLQNGTAALVAAAQSVVAGGVAAVKGLGGFHLLTAAHQDEAVARLRQLKHREEKPFALMFPNLERVRDVCEVSPLEEDLLTSSAAPIVLLRQRTRRADNALPVSALVAPANPYLGVMLPSTPLHHLLMRDIGFPVVATSGNLAEEPICTDEHEALQRIGRLADLFLVHNRPIVRHADDSIVRVVAGRAMILRRARGYAPLPVELKTDTGRSEGPGNKPCVLAVGAHLKNSIALARGSQVFISQHIGDLETPQAYTAFERVISDFEHFYEAPAALIAADAHPDYFSTRYAHQRAVPIVPVQHHYAHVLSAMAENHLEAPVLGVSWDGTGFGTDGTVWGGEFLTVSDRSFQRVAHLRTFRLPGGDKAVKEPKRSALGLLFEAYGESALEWTHLAPVRAFSENERALLRGMLQQRVHAPITSSAGRLFDGVAAILDLRQKCAFEGQAAMELEFALESVTTDAVYPVSWRPGQDFQSASNLVLDWAPLLAALLDDREKGLPVGVISMKFHNSLAEAIVELARRVGLADVVLSGGCFQNRYLTERVVDWLNRGGFRPHWHHEVPPNDGGIALGQVVAARRQAE
jgi:hydrogenase maturation protein HypF